MREQVKDFDGQYSGICRYCGQIRVFAELLPGEDADGTATRLCDCKEGRAYDLVRREAEDAEERREKELRDANEKIEFAFGPGAEERFGIAMPIMNAHARGHLHDLVARIYDEQIESITLSADGIKATMRKTSKGYIRIQRKDAQEIALEVIT